ncbi:hypothetical protein MAPG_09494 [Magnaporthiopsis poae ATCC 64411]|uniref:G domain-containing protein n=1 Tax=Magnaporthiopsis poae (strain ATCC 64411 / 73-15) TaxID=644358 RepID=A0A0C4EA38_MAGP6|nr:hypothetical protein MAPG_09494 [Magnaporthiopsis poae ATCC 64411]
MDESNGTKEEAEIAREHIEEQAKGFLAFTGVQRPPPNAVFLLVMGMTGSGKSSFVSSCTGRDVVVGHGLQSCTSDIMIFDFDLDGHKVYLVDTPGFNDTHKSDAETLATVATYLGTSFAQNIFIHGILYLHRISDNKVGGSARRNIDMLKAMIGEAAYTNVALVTTMWGGAGGGGSPTMMSTMEMREILLRREEELGTDRSFFAELIEGGARLVRHGDFDNSGRAIGSSARETDDELLRASALAIVRQLISQSRATGGPAVLLIQHELVEEKRRLEQTSAGIIVRGDLDRTAADYMGQLIALKDMIRSKTQAAATVTAMGTQQSATSASNEENREDADLETEFKEKLATVDEERQVLGSGLQTLQRKEQESLTQKLEAAEERFRAELELKERRLVELERSLQQARRARLRKTEPADKQPTPPQLSRVKEEVRKGRRALAGLKHTIDGVKEGLATGLATSMSSAVVTTVVGAIATTMVCVLM